MSHIWALDLHLKRVFVSMHGQGTSSAMHKAFCQAQRERWMFCPTWHVCNRKSYQETTPTSHPGVTVWDSLRAEGCTKEPNNPQFFKKILQTQTNCLFLWNERTPLWAQLPSSPSSQQPNSTYSPLTLASSGVVAWHSRKRDRFTVRPATHSLTV